MRFKTVKTSAIDWLQKPLLIS